VALVIILVFLFGREADEEEETLLEAEFYKLFVGSLR